MRVAIVKLSSAGDIVQALPVAAYLKAQGAHVTWIIDQRFAELVQGVDEIVALQLKPPSWTSIKQLRALSFDVLYDLQGNCKSALVTALCSATKKVGFGAKTIAEWPALLATHQHIDPPSGQNIRQDYLDLVGGVYQAKRGKKSSGKLRLVVCPGSRWPNKELTLETWQEIVERLSKEFPIEWTFTSGTPHEFAMSEKLSAHGKHLHDLTLTQLSDVLSDADGVLAVDSLPLHLAAAPTFAFFGASSAAKYAPSSAFIQGPCPYGVSFEKRCPRLRTCPTGACIRTLTAEQCLPVLRAWVVTL